VTYNAPVGADPVNGVVLINDVYHRTLIVVEDILPFLVDTCRDAILQIKFTALVDRVGVAVSYDDLLPPPTITPRTMHNVQRPAACKEEKNVEPEPLLKRT
jgi:hypothetical protein